MRILAFHRGACWSLAVLFVCAVTHAEDLPIPPQDQGLAYTRSAPVAALAAIKDSIVLHPLSRYVYAYGHKLRVDPQDILRGEPIVVDGRIHVPIELAGIVTLKPDLKPNPAPEYLADRWVYDLNLPDFEIPESVATVEHAGRTYVDLAALAEHQGLVTHRVDGLLFIAPPGTAAPRLGQAQRDAVVAQFDTPEKYADSDLPPRYIPQLKRQGVWTEHVEVTEEELLLLEGPEPEWSMVPRSGYNLEGFAHALLGSAVPEPGVYPRILFSEADLPAIRQRIAGNRIAQKSMVEIEALLNVSWLDPESSDGRVFDKLAAGDMQDLAWDAWKGGRRIPLFPSRFDGQKPGIYSSHIAYNAQCLTVIALHALLTDDDVLGRKAARAIANLYRLQAPNLDRFLMYSDSELGSNPGDANASTTQWRGVHSSVAHMDLPFALDFAGKWMTDEDKRFMQRLVAKTTYGRRTNGGDGPRRNWRDINHVTWHTTHLLALMTIEGLEGFDPEAYASGAELIADFLQWGLDEQGIMYESNGKSSGGLQFQVLNMIALARRGDNLWGHPHWRKLAEAQVLNTAPNSETSVSSGTWSGGLLATPTVMMFHAFYPENRYAEHMLTTMFEGRHVTPVQGAYETHEDLDAYRRQLEDKPGRTRLSSVTYPGFTLTLLYDVDWTSTSRADLDAPLDYVDPEQGILSSYSENSEEAVWMHMSVRSNHYLGAGHHHADAGMFHFSAGGVNWITESPFKKSYDGRFHNQVLIDGIAQPDGIQGRADWMGATVDPEAAFASADLTNAYTWRWSNQFIYFDTDDWGPRPDQYEWSLCHDPVALKAFKGTQRYKMRPWWPTGVFSNWFPVLQRPYNPVEYAHRTVGLVRGKHSYGVVIDDVRKDDQIRLYQWSAMPGPGVWSVRTKQDLSRNTIVLAKQGDERVHAGARRLRPKAGDSLLLLCVLGGEGRPAEFEFGPSKGSKFALDPYGALAEEESHAVTVPVRIETQGDGPHWQNSDQVQFFYDRIVGGCHSRQARFRTLLIPFIAGQPLPSIAYDSDTQVATVTWPDQTDTLRFTVRDDQRTGITIERDGRVIHAP